jgi:leader peptidase (prepilin peptidase)/N-methyltransferase
VPLFAPLEQHAVLLVSVVALFGLVIGSFLNVVIHRLPRILERGWRQQCAELLDQPLPEAPGERYDLLQPASHCPHCKAPIRAYDNIPLLSYLLLSGRCRHCGAGISLRYPLLELLAALLAVAVALRFGVSAQTLAGLGLTWCLLALTVIDLDHHLLPDAITLPLLWAGLLVNLGGLFTDLASAVLGAVAGYLSLWAVYHLFRLVTGKEGMGHGDFKMLAMFGAWLGWQLLPLVILLSSLVGAAVGIALIVSGRHARGVPIPFGPFLALAGWIALLWGDALVAGYLAWAQPG